MKSSVKLECSPEFCRELAATLAGMMEVHLDELRLLDASQAAQMLGVTVQTFRNIAEREGLRYVDMGERNSRWSVTELRELIARRRMEGL
jgi:predicted DNA-binding transcriptional regulator AlpA